ncbi:flavin-containing monooxygenase [Methylobacterium nonmethylotrophicum]|uniref:flavin-containing monooxygenase n=1 Tax=Methylobacterium nonmethylotrophicum TaxID=1141884 RepID=UPI0014367D34|nr:NAD(P)/FAD-dependent oxidoreductase [Methylobacterium nonmethylotrophicum]
MTGGMRVAIIGAGLSGIVMGLRLKRAGFHDFVLLEKAGRLGGTWRDNAYPGVACDVPAHFYALADAPNPDWTRRYPPGAEILRYAETVAAETGLQPHLRFGQEVVAADWTGRDWILTMSTGSTLRADAVVSATGLLHHPRLPAIPSLERFAGPVIHTARWRDDVALSGRAVGIVGTGSSGAQVIPHLAETARRLTVFQRTPAWVLPLPDRRAPAWLRHALRRAPLLLRLWHALGSEVLARTYAASFVGESPLVRRLIARRCAQALRTVRDPGLRRTLTPDFPPGCKRLVFSARYYPALQRPNVAVVAAPVREVVPEGLVTADGRLHPLDVLVLATGFDGQAYLRPLRLSGVGGATLDALWRERPQAYRAVALPKMPNFFLLLGPHSPTATVSAVKVAEWQASFILRCLEVARRERAALSPTWSALRREMARIDAALAGTVWASGCDSWYLDASGRPGLYPLPPVQYRSALAAGPDRRDFEFWDVAGSRTAEGAIA